MGCQMDLNKYTDYQLALKTIKGDFGNGEDRRKALGNRYRSVQAIVDAIMMGKYDGGYSINDISKAFDELKPSNEDFEELKNLFIKNLKGGRNE